MAGSLCVRRIRPTQHPLIGKSVITGFINKYYHSRKESVQNPVYTSMWTPGPLYLQVFLTPDLWNAVATIDNEVRTGSVRRSAGRKVSISALQLMYFSFASA